MSEYYQEFLSRAEQLSFDPEHRRKLDFNIGKYDEKVIAGKKQFSDLELARTRAFSVKNKAIHNLDKYLTDFEKKFISNGGKVIWASTEKDVHRDIQAILKAHEARLVVKQKSMVTEELEINDFLEKNKYEVLETDLGEFIVQVAGEKPYHIITPVMHKSKEDVAALFHEKFDLPPDSKPEDITLFVREKLRVEFQWADVGITGCNFLIADTGSVALTENEGNGLFTVSFPRVHIVLAGIEKIIPSMEDLDLFLPLLATHGTGQYITAYNNLVSGPRKEFERDGPDEMYVILIDNRRTELLKQQEQRKALCCIRCGACLNGCPIYRSVGGYTYNTVYSGPIGAVISPHLKHLRDYNHLSFASSLCGKCTEVCPVKIPLHELLLKNRNETIRKGYAGFKWKMVMFGWKKAMMKRWMLDFAGGGMKNKLFRMFLPKVWGPRRELPRIASRSFKQLWEERQGGKR
ncbi:MAG: lactate utilization protein [Bacteroidetes bacterium]|nr:lactate utilization protein [Bacteroidota bacterium]